MYRYLLIRVYWRFPRRLRHSPPILKSMIYHHMSQGTRSLFTASAADLSRTLHTRLELVLSSSKNLKRALTLGSVTSWRTIWRWEYVKDLWVYSWSLQNMVEIFCLILSLFFEQGELFFDATARILSGFEDESLELIEFDSLLRSWLISAINLLLIPCLLQQHNEQAQLQEMDLECSTRARFKCLVVSNKSRSRYYLEQRNVVLYQSAIKFERTIELCNLARSRFIYII